MKSPLDAYTFRARLQPALIAAAPLPITVATAWPGGLDWWTPLWTVLVACGATALLAELARDRGKEKEEVLFRRWGGKPTTLRLRHRNAPNRALLEQVHEKLTELRPELRLPSPDQEAEDPLAADERYDAAAALLREHTRDRARFPLVFEELCNYGFRRNLWGLKPTALVAVALGAGLISAACVARFLGALEVALPPLLAGMSLQVILGLVWVLRITPDWPKPAAFAYADALLGTLERLQRP